MVPDSPTTTYNEDEVDVLSVVVLSVVVLLSSLLLQEMIVRLKRNRERMMSRCFTWFPISGFRLNQCIPRFGGVLQGSGDFTWRLSDL